MNITASLQEKNNVYQVVINYKDINGKRNQKWKSTGLSIKGNNKRLANQKMQEILENFKAELNNQDNNTSTDKLFTSYMKEWLLFIQNTIEENTYDSYKVIVNKICEYFEDKKLLSQVMNSKKVVSEAILFSKQGATVFWLKLFCKTKQLVKLTSCDVAGLGWAFLIRTHA